MLCHHHAIRFKDKSERSVLLFDLQSVVIRLALVPLQSVVILETVLTPLLLCLQTSVIRFAHPPLHSVLCSLLECNIITWRDIHIHMNHWSTRAIAIFANFGPKKTNSTMLGLVTSLQMIMVVGVLNLTVLQSAPPNGLNHSRYSWSEGVKCIVFDASCVGLFHDGPACLFGSTLRK